ncbi:mannosyltransferase family protein [Pelagicoccus sp. SDUM812005]|uniref:mannosyltransferase family protein n=1 Tax=Pelagicoccus sp. SDUM812005 TaxID=3041257 RepID=UPI00280F6D4D|nr:mannosyltransferase family protein [Pelagicoccus sp. SDUM812005]MDQ8180873.1 mannosyltransferase family protein [Pelagicoccus sp. SDUM812005]
MEKQECAGPIFSKRIVVTLLFVAMVSRVLVFGTFGFLDYIDREERSSGFGEQLDSYLKKWDTGWYIPIAREGYAVGQGVIDSGQSRYAFYPVVPFAVRFVAWTTGLKVSIAGVLLSNLAFIGSIFLFYRFCRLRGASQDCSLWACLLLAFCPHGFVFSAFYTESVFLFISLLVVNLIASECFVLGGLAGAILTATRANGLFVGIYFLWSWISSLWSGRRAGKSLWQSLLDNDRVLLGGALVPLGLFLFWWYCFESTGDAFAQLNSLSEGWGRHSVAPWSNAWILLTSESYANRFLVLWVLFLGIGAIVLCVRRMYSDFVFCVLNLGLFLSGSLSQSMLRYAIVLFPIYLGFALLLERRPAFLAVLLSIFAVTNTLLIYAWYSGDVLGI